MINRVYIRNFRRIEEAEIEIRDGLTCLTGQNGTGKSSIIEAIEFCLYGKTKSGTNKDTIRRHGATDDEPTYTEVDFELGDRHYRCRRYLTRKLSTQATLHAYDGESYARLREADATRSDSSSGQRNPRDLGTSIATSPTGVTEAVSELFGIKYSGFIASFVARQKELDSLASSLTPEARKKFFLELLDYSRLDSVKSEYNKEIKALKTALAALEKQLMSPTDIQRQIDETTKALSEIQGRVTNGARFVSNQEERISSITREITEMSTLSGQLAAAAQDLERDRASIEKGRGVLENLENDERKYRAESAGYNPETGVAGQLAEVQQVIDKANAYILQRRERDQVSGIINQRQRELQRAQADVTRLRKATAKQPDVEEANTALSEAKTRLGQLTGRKTMIDGELAKMRELISSVDTGQSAKCPTCGTDISSIEGRRHLDGEMARLTDEASEMARSITAAQSDVKAKERSYALARKSLATYQKDVRDLATAEANLTNISTDIAERSETVATKERYLQDHAGDNRTDFQLAELEAKRAELAKKVQREEEMRRSFLTLQKVLERQVAAKNRMEELQASVAEKTKLLADNEGFQEKFASKQAEKETEERNLQRYRKALEDLRYKQGQSETLLGNLRDMLRMANEQARDRASMRSRLETYLGASEVVGFLREFLPAKIAPTLSARASKLLDVATNGMYRMLEINDSYEVFVYTDDDVRPVAMMSGGEQDIISLCIRIAIAEMILSTTGIHRQTIILDEIFGALDDERRASACHALQSLGQMIPRIVCITHIEEIKDLADYTYVVERDENGVSHVREVKDSGLNLMPRIGFMGNESEESTNPGDVREAIGI